MNTFFISVGSNIHPYDNVKISYDLISSLVTTIEPSHVYETKAIDEDFLLKQNPYLNMVIKTTSPLTLTEFKVGVCRFVEDQMGRKRYADCNAPRCIDLDVVLFNDEVIEINEIRIPDPGILKYAYILVSLADLVPLLRHPITGELIKDIAQRHYISSLIRKVVFGF